MDKVKKIEKLIKEKSKSPIVSVQIGLPNGILYNQAIVITEVKFSIQYFVSSNLIKKLKAEEIADLLAKQIDDCFREKMELAGIEKLELKLYD